MSKTYTHVSLFSGAGGLDIGLEQAGFHTVWANDFNHDACETHRLWSNATVVEGDIGKVDYDTIPDCDIASFGFPCQGFSLSGQRKINDSRNVLYRHCVKLVEKKQPKLFLAENVKGLLTLGGGKIKDAIIADFESKGYAVSINLVNAADYHVPEDRQRILLVGIRKDIAEKYGAEFKVPAPFPDRISIRQALEGLAPATDDEICKEPYSSRYMSRNRKRGWDSVSFTIPAMAKQVPLWPGSPDMVKVGKDLWQFGEKGSTRRLSYREAAAIQTFPKDMMLKCNGIEYQREKMFPWMGKKRLDFFLPGKNIAIECQGVQHFYPYGSDDRDFEARKQRDTDKYNECTSNGVQVLYYMSDMIPLPDEMAGKYRYMTSLDELLEILNDK